MERLLYEFRKPGHNNFISVPHQINKIVPVTEEGKLRVGGIQFSV